MNRVISLLALFFSISLFSTSIPAQSTQSAEKIIDQYKKAVGGKAVKKVKSLTMSGTIKNGNGSPGRFSFLSEAPDRFRVDIEYADQKVSQCYNGNSAWRQDRVGLRTLLGDEART